MAEYIKREALIDRLLRVHLDMDNLYTLGIQRGITFAIEFIKEMPTADVAPVVRSNWEITDHESAYGTKCYHCHQCGEDEWREDKPKFCPNCGARMDGDSDT